MNYSKFPRRKYLQGPTPVASMPSLSKALGGKVYIFVKRDDLLPGAAGGLIDLVRKGHSPAGANPLFLHTGGSPALYAYLDTFRQQ